ncbi:MAG: hypothetical protein J4F30_04735 [Acidobacteria bacterium]|nr:hypothetical protein [Acidobacteriota bacterium]
MDTNVVATVLTGLGVLLGVWRLVGVAVEGVRLEVDGLRRDLTAEIRAVNQRIDAVLLADRNASAG